MAPRKPEELWEPLVQEAGDKEVEEAASVRVADAEKELSAAGFDVAAERAKAGAFLDSLGSGESSKVVLAKPEKPEEPPVPQSRIATVRPPRRPEPRSRVMWVAIAATIVVAAGVVYTALNPAPPAPYTPPPVPSSPVVASAELRRQARSACDQGKAPECLALLDRAKAQDPAGDTSPEMVQLRDRAIKAITAPLK